MATPVFCVFLDEEKTCPVCLELLYDPCAPQVLNFPHICCSLCIQRMKIGRKSNRIVDCPDCCHVSRDNIGLHHLDSGKTVQIDNTIELVHGEHYSGSALLLDIEGSCNSDILNNNRGASYCVFIPEDLPCPTCHDNKRESVTCNSCSDKLNSSRGSDNIITNSLIGNSTEAKIDMDKESKEIDEYKQRERELTILQGIMEKHLENQQKLIAKQTENAIIMIQNESQRMMNVLQKNIQSKVRGLRHERRCLKSEIRSFQRARASVASDSSEFSNKSDKSDSEKESHKHNSDNSNKTTAIDTKPTNHILGMAKFVTGYHVDVCATIGSLLEIRKLGCELVQEIGLFLLAAFVTTAANGSVIVSDCSSNKVYVYMKDNTGRYENDPSLCLTSQGSKAPDGVAVTTEGKYLVARFRDVDIYSQLGKYEGALNFKNNNGPGNDRKYATAIEVMHDGKIIVGDSYNSTLTIISQDYAILRTIHTSIKPARIASRLNGIIASFWRENKICLIDIDSGLKVQTFDVPHSSAVCYHAGTDSLVVGRCLEMTASTMPKTGSGVIEQYCASTGRFVGRIAEGLFLPRDFVFVTNDLLAVADTNKIKLFKVG